MKIAGAQMDVALGETDANLEKMSGLLREATAEGASLMVFPECAVTGYCFESLEEARPFAQPVPGPATDLIGRACADLEAVAIFGMLEAVEGRVFNAAVMVGPDGVLASYRKSHMPFLGIDRYATPGDRPFAVHEVGDVKIGMNICYDASFPEAARMLSLLGADLIALPTNWPPGSECTALNVIITRAMENAIYYIAVNRVGTERGFSFIGHSRICDPNGQTLAASSGSQEEILYANIDPALARRKYIVRVAGKHEVDRMADRRPEMYTLLSKPHDLKSPRHKHQFK